MSTAEPRTSRTSSQSFSRSSSAFLVMNRSRLEAPRRGRPSPSHVVVHYANRTRTVEYLLYRLRETYPSATVYERPITLSIQMNLGHGILGLVGD